MKKIFCLIICITLLSSCYNRKIVEGEVIIEIKHIDEKTSLYIVKGEGGGDVEYPRFYARRGLYNVGDTVKFCK